MGAGVIKVKKSEISTSSCLCPSSQGLSSSPSIDDISKLHAVKDLSFAIINSFEKSDVIEAIQESSRKRPRLSSREASAVASELILLGEDGEKNDDAATEKEMSDDGKREDDVLTEKATSEEDGGGENDDAATEKAMSDAGEQ